MTQTDPTTQQPPFAVGPAETAVAPRPVRLAAPSLRGVVRIVAIVVGCAFALYLAWRLRDVLRLVVIALFLALALIPVVDALDRRARVPRAVVILALYAALAGGGSCSSARSSCRAWPTRCAPRSSRSRSCCCCAGGGT